MGTDPGDATADAGRPGEPDVSDVLSLVLPSVLDGLAAETRRTRASAAWTACRLAEERPELGAELADRLVRAADRTPREPLVRTLSSLHERHPESVGDALRAFDGTVVRAVRRASAWDFDAALRADGGNAAVDESQRVIDADAPGVTVYQRQMPDAPEPGRSRSSRSNSGASSPDVSTTPTPDRSGPDPGETEPSGPDRDERGRSEGTDSPDSAVERRRRIQAAENSESFAAVQLVSDFDEVSVLEPPRRDRYGHVLPSRARIDEAEYGVDLLFFDEPGEEAQSFRATMGERLDQWYCADEATGVAAVADYGEHPRPWVATPRAETTLADRDVTDLGVALGDARELAAGLAAVHERGLVHGGIDPHDVIYPANGFASDPVPSLSHLGVMAVFREHFGPAEYVDPRYAAPEYFDDGYGRIDHTTDVYHLGAVLFELFAGRPPYTGTYDEVRSAILDERVPVPSEVRPEVPASVDEVVATAIAPRKLNRFEAATQLSNGLERLG